MRVLIIEDEILVVTLLEEYLADLGCEIVGSAGNLDQAVALASSSAIDVALLDISLDGQMSYPVAEALRARGIPFVLATGHSGATIPRELGDAPILVKPYRRDRLARALSGTRGS